MIQAGHAKTDQIRQAINNEDYKRAVKLATKLEKNDLAKAMLAYALERLGKRDEALDICEALQSTTNETVSIWISHVLMLAKKHKDIAKMHVKAFESASPQHVERYCALGVHCFESLVRTYDLAEAQTQALRLAKASSTGALEKSSIWLWTSTLAFLRASIDCGPDDPTLQLSEAFFLKAEACAKQDKHLNGLPLKRWILLRRNKTENALKNLSFLPDESPSAKVWTRSLLLRDLATPEAEEEEFNILLNMVQTMPEAHDDFRAIARLSRLACKKLDSEREPALRAVLDELVKANEKLRGPLLGYVRLELEKLFAGMGSGQALREAVVRYVSSKGHLAAAFPDLQNDLGVFAPRPVSTGNQTQLLPGDELSPKGLICPFLIPPKTYAAQDRQTRRWSMEALQRFTVEETVRMDLIADLKKDDRISAHQIMRFVGADSFKSDAEMDLLWRTYLEHANRETSAEQDKDDWTLLAAHVLTDLYLRSDAHSPSSRDRYLIVALGALEKRSAVSPDNFQLKLAINEIAGHYLGAGRVALEAYRGLRVKQIQLDALGYVGLADLSALGLFEEAHDLARSACEFNARGRGETAECFADAFRFVETSSPVEIMRLENRLRDSFQFALSVVERCVCSLVPPPQTDKKKKSEKQQQQQQQNEDDIGGVKKPIGTIFARVKVEVEDPPRGESHVCLPEHRLAVVMRRIASGELDQLCMNHDLDVQASFDPPFSAAFNEEKSRLATRGPCARVPRQCANSTEYLTSWQERMQLWMKLRVIGTSCLVSPCSETKQEELRVMMKELGLLNSNVFGDLWDVSVSVLGLFSSPKLSLTLAESIRAFDEKLTQAMDGLVKEFTQNPRDVLERLSLALLHPGMWMYAVVARLNVAHKKANKAKPFPYDVATFVAIRDATSKLFSKLSQLMSKLEESCKSIMVDVAQVMEKMIPNGYEDAVRGALNAVVESRIDSCKRLSALASFFGTLELHSA